MTLHSWDVSYEEARKIQNQLRWRLEYPVKESCFRWVGGADVAYDKRRGDVLAVIVVLDRETGKVEYEAQAVVKSRFPYIPGLLSFREAPAVLQAWKNLGDKKPQALMLDGQGLAHPRRFGLACHLGVWLKLPTVGCAKSRLIGVYEEPGTTQGCWSDLKDGDEVIGAVVRTRSRVRPLFISPGFLLSLPGCIQFVLEWCQGFRLPEPTRQAHLRVTALRRKLI